jgi:hypothetical protein
MAAARQLTAEDVDHCRDIHSRWYDDFLKPKIIILVASLLSATLGSSTGIFWYMSRNAIRDYDLQAYRQFVALPAHERDISRIEHRIEKMEETFAEGTAAILDRLDRNFTAIEAKPRERRMAP